MGTVSTTRARIRLSLVAMACFALLVSMIGTPQAQAAPGVPVVSASEPVADTYLRTVQPSVCPPSGRDCLPIGRPPTQTGPPQDGGEGELELGYAVDMVNVAQATITTYRPIMRFATPEVPSGYRLEEATLELSVTGEAAPSVELLPILSAWSEDTSTSPQVGGTPVASLTLATGRQSVDVTAVVSDWLHAPDTNHGLLLSPSPTEHRAQVAAREAADAELRPTLTVTLEPAEGHEDDTPPTVAFVEPGDGRMVWDTETMTVDATDDVGVDRVVFHVGPDEVATVSTTPYTFEWDTSSVVDGDHLLTATAFDLAGNSASVHVGVRVANDASMAEQLDADYDAGLIDVDTYVLQSIYSVLGDSALDERYTGDELEEASAWLFGVLSRWDLLDDATQQTVEGYFTPIIEVEPDSSQTTMAVEEATLASVGDRECGWLVRLAWENQSPTFDCRVRAGETTVWWNSDRVPNPPGDGLPEVVAGYAEGFLAAGTTFDDLDYRSVGTTNVFVALPGSTGVSLPFNSQILMPRSSSNPGWFAAHELFHQYQYEYLGISGWSLAPDNVLWWLEASAEWGAHQVLADNPHLSGRFAYASKMPAFFDDRESALDRFRPIEGGRQYGAFVVAEWLHANGGASGPDTDVIRQVWENMNFLTPPLAAFDDALPGGFGPDEISRMWTDLYFLNIDIPDRVDEAETNQWRAGLEETVAPYMVQRPTSRQLPGLRNGDSRQEEFHLARAAGTFLEIAPLDAGPLTVEVVDPDGRVTVDAYALTDYDTDPTSSPDVCTDTAIETVSPSRIVVTVDDYDPDACAGVSVIVSKDLQNAVSRVTATVSLGHQVDTTIDNGLIRLGINPEGHLNVPGFDPSSGTGTTTVGLRYLPTAADALAPGCHCEGWGVADPATGAAGWADQSEGGAFGLVVEEASFDDEAGVSQVLAADRLRVRHEFSPAAETANLYRIDVTIEHAGRLGSGTLLPIAPAYRRTMDWDVEPTAFSEYVTIQPTSIQVPPALVFSSNDGFASSNPLGSRTDLGATGFFTDFGPIDQGAMFDLQFGSLWPGQSVEFTMWYGAASNATEALQAITDVGAQLYSVAKPDIEGGAETGEPNTFIWAYHGPAGGETATGAQVPGTMSHSGATARTVDDYLASLPPSTTRTGQPGEQGG